jgi:predicted aconitase
LVAAEDLRRQVVDLTPYDRAFLAGERGAAGRMAMRILVGMAEVYGAGELLDITSAHIDGCLFHGDSGLEFAERLVAGGAQVRVPATLNVGALDLLHADNFNGTPDLARRARRLMKAYESMGCQPIWTCAPYQAAHRPALGEQVAWAESNAIAFVNSVLGARSNRYGDFIDICAAITGRVPACGLHVTENRRGRIVYDLHSLPARLLESPVLAPVLGYHVGTDCRTIVPVIDGLPATTDEDFLKALGAAAASSGAVALFHVVGVTPEAPTLDAALHGLAPQRVERLTLSDLEATRDLLSTVDDEAKLAAVALGSPHFSYEEFARLVPLIERWAPAPEVEFVVCTNRVALARIEHAGWAEILRQAGVRLVVDTCVVVTPILRAVDGAVMTNSGKFAHYTPGNTGLAVIFGSLRECVRSAAAGRVWRDPELWGDR